MQQITRSLYQIALGPVNVFVVEDGDGLTLIDAGLPGSKDKIFAAITRSGKDPRAIKQLILTHCHPDHAGGAAEVQAATGARVLAHEGDAEPIAQGEIPLSRPRHRSPGVLNWVLYQAFIKRSSHRYAAVPVDRRLHHGEVLPLAGGLEVLHTPGHSTGHIALLLRSESVLIAGDLCMNMLGLDWSTVYEDRERGRDSIVQAAGVGFETAVFGHGKPLMREASTRLKERFA